VTRSVYYKLGSCGPGYSYLLVRQGHQKTKCVRVETANQWYDEGERKTTARLPLNLDPIRRTQVAAYQYEGAFESFRKMKFKTVLLIALLGLVYSGCRERKIQQIENVPIPTEGFTPPASIFVTETTVPTEEPFTPVGTVPTVESLAITKTPGDFASSPDPTLTATLWVSPTPSPPPNIVLIVVDSLRADHVSAYGYERSTTPNLDQLMAAQGVLFKQAISTSSWTCPSNAALMSGQMPSTLNSTWTTNANALSRSAHTLAEYLKEAGYYTAGFVNNACVHGRFGFSQGFDVYDDILVNRPGIHNNNKARANEMNNRTLHWLQENWQSTWRVDQPLFLFIYYMDPHLWYNPLPPFDTLYDPDYAGPITPAVFGIGKDAMSGKLVIDERDNQHIQALYDGEITYWDTFFKPLMDSLETMGVLDNTLVIVTADHGEAFNEHGTWTHGTSVYQEEIHVPLIMRYPGKISPGLVIDTPVQSYDLMPTILDYVGLTISSQLQAKSLRLIIENPILDPHRQVYSEVDSVADPGHWAYWQAPKEDLRSIQLEEWKYIHHVGNQDADELYFLAEASPYENENLLRSLNEKSQDMLSRTQAWFGIR